MKKRRLKLSRAAGAAVAATGAVGGLLAAGAPAFASPSSVTLTGPSTPTTIYPGKTAQSVAGWTVGVPSNYTVGDKMTVVVAAGSSASANCAAGTADYVDFAATPTVSVAAASTAPGGTAPTVTAALSTNSGDPAFCQASNDVLTLSITGGTPGAGAHDWNITVGGVSYNAGSAAATGAIHVLPTYYPVSGATTVTSTSPSNATLGSVALSANSPATPVAPGSTDVPIGNLTVAEAVTGSVPANYVCVSLPAASSTAFDTSATPTASASGGGAVVSSSGTAGGGSTTTVTRVNATTLAFDVTTASTTAPATYTLSGMAVDSTGTAAAGPVRATVTDNQNSSCTAATPTTLSPATGLRMFSLISNSRIYGQTADATAAALLQKQFDYATGTCPGGAGTRPVVLATDQNYPDALSGSYVAGKLGPTGTGILLTPTASLSSSTLTALRLEGITSVYVMGGPIAISNNVISQLKSTPSYTCGGTAQRFTSSGAAQTLQVTQIYGQTADGTAQMAAQYFGSAAVGNGTFPGAYGTMYNNTAGTASTSGPTTAKTAILATNQTFPDAMAASAVAYNEHFPVLLTAQGSLSPEAAAGITNLGITQVIMMGGQVAISNSVVTSLQNMGVSVLRIAGQDYTDTAQLLAQFELNHNLNAASQAEGLHWGSTTTPGTANLVRGDFYADGLTGSVVAGNNSQPILLAFNPSSLGGSTTTFLNAAGSANGVGANTSGGNGVHITSLTTIGGPLAIQPATNSAALSALAKG